MTLVAIPTNEYINGYSASLGARQTIDSRALSRLLAFAKAFHAALGIRLDITEASRSRPRQDYLWSLWQAYLARGKRPPWAALAARPYTSIHDAVRHGNAGDLGSGVQTFGTAAHQWAAIHGPEYGVHPTGLQFSSPEPWHFDIELTEMAGDSGTPINNQEEEDEMALRMITWRNAAGVACCAQYSDTGFWSPVTGATAIATALNASGIPSVDVSESVAIRIESDCLKMRTHTA